jgi:catechol 2,3-dioxygenase-like lactoylglutathione lyase family enzyme
MPISARYTHTNLIARDWRRLAEFYEQVLGCTPVPPERHLAGSWLEEATHLPGAKLQGQHLRLPGFGASGPTLEIFEYAQMLERPATAVNRPGLAHLAFAVDDVPAACAAVLAAGGSAVGQVVTADIAGASRITFAYVADPEGNVIELQQWERG